MRLTISKRCAQRRDRHVSARTAIEGGTYVDRCRSRVGSPTLQSFTLDDLAPYTAEQAFPPTASSDFRVFYVGRDDVHGVLMHLFTRVSLSVKMNMFGYDDDDLNNVLMGLVRNPARLDYEHGVAYSQPQPTFPATATSPAMAASSATAQT